MAEFDRVVVGAGIAGLLAAYRAVNKGEKVAIVDRAERAGGVIQPLGLPIANGHITVDAGAEAFSIVGSSCERLIAELGMSDEIVHPARADARIFFSKDLKYKIPHGYMGIPSSLDDAELSGIISSEGIRLAKQRDALIAPASADLMSLTIAQLIELRLGKEFLEKLVDPVVAGVQGSTSIELNASSTFPLLVQKFSETNSLIAAAAILRSTSDRPGSAVASLAGGMFQLIDRLVTLLIDSGVAFKLGQNVYSLEELDAEKFTIATASKGARQLILGRTIDGTIPAESDATADSTLVFAVVASTQLNEFPIGSGALVATKSSLSIKATTHLNAKWAWVQARLSPNEHVLRVSVGRGREDSAIDLTDADLHALVKKELGEIYGVGDLQFNHLQSVRWPGALNRPNLKSKSILNALRAVADEKQIELCGSYVSGNGLLGIIKDHYERSKNESVKI